MRKEYDFKNAKRNPFAALLKKQELEEKNKKDDINYPLKTEEVIKK